MTPARKRRLFLVLGILVGVGIAGALALTAFQKNVMFFFDPSQVAAGEVKQGQRFRLGGMVSKGSIERVPGTMEVRFTVTDFKHELPVTYTGILPDLFREGQGVVAHGHLNEAGVFVADEVLAKHDEKYMPPEVARSLKDTHEAYAPKGASGPSGSAAPTTAGDGAEAAPGEASGSASGSASESAAGGNAITHSPIGDAAARSAQAGT
jgi:cytochrome c-type biogenesis protein CcmE